MLNRGDLSVQKKTEIVVELMCIGITVSVDTRLLGARKLGPFIVKPLQTLGKQKIRAFSWLFVFPSPN